ncbi:amidohydrolase family protein [Asanoa sp. NPDC050611]|uniref:amidohydrolase family protein n=1 Tax=Asanoa sp. NPDC050611 TaxID=3157098 RepID=UPI0033CA9FC6
MDVDLLVRHGHVIAMDDAGTLIPDGAVAVAGGRIVDVGADATVAARCVAARELDAGGAPVHPGLVESHLHASFHTFRGALPDHLAEDDSFDTFESVFYNHVTDEDEYLAVALAAIEMIRNGTTCFLEAGTVLSPDSAARAASLVGIRAVLGDPFIWDQPDGFAQGMRAAAGNRSRIARAPGSRAEALDRLGTELRRNADPDALVTGHVAVLGLGTASEELMLAAKSRADAAGCVLNIHQSYSPADTGADRLRFGKDPLLHLADIGFLDRNVTLAHANHLGDEECEALLDRGASIAWAPAASMMWGHGGCFRGRHAELHRRGATIALGSDSPNWSNDFDLFRQANLAVLTAREAHRDRTYLVAEDGLWMATRAGARAVGLADWIGSIEVGKRADIVVHTLRRPELVPVTDMVRNLVYSSRSKSVSTVIVNGRIVLDEGAFVGVDEGELLREVQRSSTALLRRMGKVVEPNRVARRG